MRSKPITTDEHIELAKKVIEAKHLMEEVLSFCHGKLAKNSRPSNLFLEF